MGEEKKQSIEDIEPYSYNKNFQHWKIHQSLHEFPNLEEFYFEKKYAVIKKLGEGTYGEVLEVELRATGARRAVKIIPRSNKRGRDEQFRTEIEIVKELSHPNVMKLFEFFEDEFRYFLVMELYNGGELFNLIEKSFRFAETDAASIIEQCLDAIRYLHKNGIVHRDLKPENLVLKNASDLTIKVVDFGLAAKLNRDEPLTEMTGTCYYAAPEVLNAEDGESYDEKCDIWSLGIILHTLLCGYPPFDGKDDKEIFDAIRDADENIEFVAEDWVNVSHLAIKFVERMLTRDPKKRPSASECLKDPWLASKRIRGNLNCPSANFHAFRQSRNEAFHLEALEAFQNYYFKK